ncbi:MAG: glycerol-3-phosphate 1-O-acyltransferase PlsY [Lachnospiraceae bacterium]|nr:glycerol-3-phosphate 1-O-acyltransferase PlsY [Lachnospiraceae bacterium]
MIIQRILCIIIGYCFGLIQTGFLYGKMKGIDIREHGSGNSGATNTLRTLGTKAGFIVLFGDALKCIIAMLITYLLFGKANPEYRYLFMIYTAFGAVIGHDFPFYLNFKGGKGIAVTAGLIISFGPMFVAVHLGVFALVFLTTHYVSLGSLLIYATFFVMMIICGQTGYFDKGGVIIPQPLLTEMYVIIFIMTVIAYWRHRANIIRLLHHNESKVYLTEKLKKKTGKDKTDELV